MYIPSAFRVEDRGKLWAFMRAHAFATLVTSDQNGAPFATHLPLQLEAGGELGVLRGHVARGNAHWKYFERATLAIFHGPHSYVSPSNYAAAQAVPTWNYVAVHAYGTPQIIDDDERVNTMLEQLSAEYETTFVARWRDELPEDWKAKMRRGIVAFEMPIARLEGKWKLSQNRSDEDRRGVREALETSEREIERETAQLMRDEPSSS